MRLLDLIDFYLLDLGNMSTICTLIVLAATACRRRHPGKSESPSGARLPVPTGRPPIHLLSLVLAPALACFYLTLPALQVLKVATRREQKAYKEKKA